METPLEIQDTWSRFLSETGRDPKTPCLEAFYFGDSQALADELLELVLSGRKRATTSSVLTFKALGLSLPEPGSLSLVTDFAGHPRCVIETTAVTCLTFKDMTFELAKREGEDSCLETWIEGHRRFFQAEAQTCGYTFTEDLPILFEDFRVIYPPELV